MASGESSMALLSGVLINFMGGKKMLHSALLHLCLNFQERNTNVKHGLNCTWRHSVIWSYAGMTISLIRFVSELYYWNSWWRVQLWQYPTYRVGHRPLQTLLCCAYRTVMESILQFAIHAFSDWVFWQFYIPDWCLCSIIADTCFFKAN